MVSCPHGAGSIARIIVRAAKRKQPDMENMVFCGEHLTVNFLGSPDKPYAEDGPGI